MWSINVSWYLEICVVLCATDRGRVDLADDLVAEREKSKLLQEEMEATLHDIQNMWTPRLAPARSSTIDFSHTH